MSASHGFFLDASDLGLEPDTDVYREFCEEVGSSPPWATGTMRAFFDRRYAGWNDPPEELPVSSPVSRLQFLAKALHKGDAPGVEEALRELDQEVQNSQLRIICQNHDGNEEMLMLLWLVGELGVSLLDEREGRRSEASQAKSALKEAETNRRLAMQDAVDQTKADAQKKIDEAISECESQQRRADALRGEVDALQTQIDAAALLNEEAQAFRAENRNLTHELEALRDELREAKAQRASLAVAHEESECALADLTRRMEQQAGVANSAHQDEGMPYSAHPRSVMAKASAQSEKDVDGGRDVAETLATKREAFACGAQAAIGALGTSACSPLRPVFLAWRCARVEAKLGRLASAAAAESLQADLALTGQLSDKTGDPAGCGREGCCCRREAGMSRCCRGEKLTSVLEDLHQQRLRAEGLAEQLRCVGQVAAPSAPPRLSISQCLLRASTAITIAGVVGLHIEPQVSGGW